MCVCVCLSVTQSCPTLCDTMNYTVHGILQAKILEWVAFPFSRGSSQPRSQTQVSCIAGRFFISWVMYCSSFNLYNNFSPPFYRWCSDRGDDFSLFDTDLTQVTMLTSPLKWAMSSSPPNKPKATSASDEISEDQNLFFSATPGRFKHFRNSVFYVFESSFAQIMHI